MVLNSDHLGSLPIARIAIVRSLPGLGDLLCAVPAWRALRTALPQAEMTLVGLPWAQSFVERFGHYLDHFVEFPGYPGIPEVTPRLQQLPTFFTKAQQTGFDLALQMHGNGIISNPFTVLLGARVNAGFYLSDQYCPDVKRFLPYPKDDPEVWRHLRLMEFLGVPLQGEALEFPLREQDFSDLYAIEEASSLVGQEEYVCIHPGASVRDRRWAPENFAVVADALAAHGFQVVLTGTAAEANITAAVRASMRSKAIDLAGRTSLGAIAALLSNAQLLICNDTGISHLAAALRVKSVVIFTASDPRRWAPLDRDRHRIVGRQEEQESSDTSLTANTSAAVMAEVEDLLSQKIPCKYTTGNNNISSSQSPVPILQGGN